MKKILIASTALVAAGVMTTGAASASEKIKLQLGGFSKWWVVGAWNDSSYGTAGNGNANDYANVDVKGDNEIYFGGSTKLDNGMEVGINIELEAGGNTDNTADPIDKSFVYLSGGFGKFIVGSESNGAHLLHVMAPDAAGNMSSDGILTGGYGIARPTAVTRNVSTEIDTGAETEKLTYVAPTFYGLTVGASYIPDAATEDNATPATANEAYGVGALYANSFGPVDVKVSAGYVTYDIAGTTERSGEWSVGTQLSYAGFTVGGAYRDIQQNLKGNGGAGGNGAAANNATESSTGYAWDAGIQYASGPYAVSFVYFNSVAAGSLANATDDEMEVYQVSGKYSLGAGVDVLATIGHVEYDDETNSSNRVNSTHNEGWAVMTGLSLAF